MHQEQHNEHCMVCGEQLEYLNRGLQVSCNYCGSQEQANIICPKGHYVCDNCHGREAYDQLVAELCKTDHPNPLGIALQLFDNPQLPMLGCEHAVIAAGALLVGLRNSRQLTVSDQMLDEALQRTRRQSLGGYCGLTGVCGVTVGIGAAFSVLLGAACPKDQETRQTMQVVGRVVQAIAELTGPCCCKAFVRVALQVAADACQEFWGISFLKTEGPACPYGKAHPHGCRGEQCPYKGHGDV